MRSLSAEVGTATAGPLAAGVIDEPLPAAARLSRRTLSVVTATSNEERVPETPNDMPQARPARRVPHETQLKPFLPSTKPYSVNPSLSAADQGATDG